jgi:hypothetical protein
LHLLVQGERNRAAGGGDAGYLRNEACFDARRGNDIGGARGCGEGDSQQ